MGFFRNPEVKWEFIAFFLITSVFSSCAFLLFRPAGVAAFIAFIIAGAFHFISSYMRYRRIASLARDIDSVLHGDERLTFSQYSEGELSVLQNEILKMTTVLRERADALVKEKTRLADSVADISHQIKTPLTSVNLIVSMLSDDSLSPERRSELTTELFGLLSRTDSLVSSLLKMSRLDAGAVMFKKDNVSVSRLASLAISAVSVAADVKNQTITTDIPENTTFCGDLFWSSEALTNIIKNCSEHTPEGGIIDISASENGIYTEITISDTGEGLSENDLPNIFERFYKGKNSSENSFGIGLALAKMIITAQNGTIKAENRREGGAMFRIKIYKGVI